MAVRWVARSVIERTAPRLRSTTRRRAVAAEDDVVVAEQDAVADEAPGGEHRHDEPPQPRAAILGAAREMLGIAVVAVEQRQQRRELEPENQERPAHLEPSLEVASKGYVGRATSLHFGSFV